MLYPSLENSTTGIAILTGKENMTNQNINNRHFTLKKVNDSNWHQNDFLHARQAKELVYDDVISKMMGKYTLKVS